MSVTFEDIFNAADKSGDGHLSIDELRTLLVANGYQGDDNELKAIFASVDLDNNGKISKEEFLTAMNDAPEDVHKRSTYRALFRKFDKDGSGFITKDELDEVFKSSGQKLKNEDVERILKMADTNADGKIDYNEFVASLTFE